jgi:hypothetical protein
MFFVALALVFTGVLVTTIRLDALGVLAVTFAVAFLTWRWTLRQPRTVCG